MYETTKTHNAEFRAFDRQDRRMIYHRQAFIPAMVTNLGVFRLDHTLKEDRWELIEDPDRFVLMQYSGQNDSNNTKIYEMDQVEVQMGVQIFKGWVQLGPYLQDGSGEEYEPSKCFGFYVDAIGKNAEKDGVQRVPKYLHKCALGEFDTVTVIGHYFD